MNYRKLRREILDRYWDDDSPRVTRVLKKLARGEASQTLAKLKADPTVCQCGCGRWVNLQRKFATCSCGNSFW